MTRKLIDWDNQPLGKRNDTALARELDVAPGTVRRARQERGIAPCPVREWRGTRHLDWSQQPLGQMTDVALGKMLGVSSSVVLRQRVKRGIAPASVGPSNVRQANARRAKTLKRKINWDAQPLGQMSDAVVARRLGVAVATVTQQRLKRNLPLSDEAKAQTMAIRRAASKRLWEP